MDDNKPIKPEAKTLKQLAASYNIGVNTMRTWLHRVGVTKPGEKRQGYIFTPAEVKTIYEKIGEP